MTKPFQFRLNCVFYCSYTAFIHISDFQNGNGLLDTIHQADADILRKFGG